MTEAPEREYTEAELDEMLPEDPSEVDGERDPLWIRLREVGGQVEEGELRYQLSRRGSKLYRAQLERLIEAGYVRRDQGGLQAVIPVRTDRHQNHGKSYADEEILDRVALWALVVGKPPTKAHWAPETVRRKSLAPLEDRVEAWHHIIALYEDGDWPSETTVRERFGSLNSALVLAGFEARSTGRQEIEPYEPRPIRKPKFGQDVLRAAHQRVEAARLAYEGYRTNENRRTLREALYDEAVAAFTEADRL